MRLIKVIGVEGDSCLVNEELIISAKLDNGRVILNTAGSEIIIKTDIDNQRMVDYVLANYRLYSFCYIEFTKLGYANIVHEEKMYELERELNPSLYKSYKSFKSEYEILYKKYEKLLVRLKERYNFTPTSESKLPKKSMLSYFTDKYEYFIVLFVAILFMLGFLTLCNFLSLT